MNFIIKSFEKFDFLTRSYKSSMDKSLSNAFCISVGRVSFVSLIASNSISISSEDGRSFFSSTEKLNTLVSKSSRDIVNNPLIGILVDR